MQQIVIGTIIAFFISFYLLPVIIHLANKKKLVDIPDERKIHTDPVPRFGGIGIFGGFISSILLSASINNQFIEFQYLLAAFLIIFFLGVGDDVMVLSPFKKFIGQLVASFILIFKGHLLINNLHGFLGIQQIPDMLSYLLTYITIIVIINAINLIDGVDGLAGTLSLISILFFGTWLYLNGDIAYSLIAFSLLGSILAFLYYNHHPAKIFMGDAGSMMLGLINAIMVIRFINLAPTAHTLPVTASPAIGFGLLLIPLMDTLRVFCIRLSHRVSPFSPDRNHIHHLFLDKGFTSLQTTFTLALLSLCFSLLFFCMASFNTTVVFALEAILFFTVISALHLYEPATMRVKKKEDGEVVIEEPRKIRLKTLFKREKQTV